MINLEPLRETTGRVVGSTEQLREAILSEYRIDVEVILSYFSTGVAFITIGKDGMEIFRCSVGSGSDLARINGKLHRELFKQRDIVQHIR